MSVEFTIRLSEREAAAVLRADGFDVGMGVHKGVDIRHAAFKINEGIIRVLRDRDDNKEQT